MRSIPQPPIEETWINYYRLEIVVQISGYLCAVRDCMVNLGEIPLNYQQVGAHVYFEGIDNTLYIVPMCNRHNDMKKKLGRQKLMPGVSPFPAPRSKDREFFCQGRNDTCTVKPQKHPLFCSQFIKKI